MTVLGIDLGNYYTKVSNGISFISKVSEFSNINDNNSVTINNRTLYMETGEFDSEPRKAYKKNILHLLKYALKKSNAVNPRVVVGLPIGQYKKDKEYFINRILQSGIVQDVEVQPEGLLTIPNNYEGLILDLGGGTTDICLIIKEGNKRRVKEPYSVPYGMHKLESDFVNMINSQYGLDLQPFDADRIITNGLYIYGERKEFSMDVYKSFVNSIVNRIQTDYSIKTNNVMLVGGGAIKLFKAFKNRIPQCEIIPNSFFANANAFKRIGDVIWK
jgi:plasmid segregation protein ParM